MSRGSAYLKEWEQRLLDDRNASRVLAKCAFCNWYLEGSVAETRAAYSLHRLESHPEIQPKPRHKRHRLSFTSAKNLDDNIANARKQGAAGWAGSE